MHTILATIFPGGPGLAGFPLGSPSPFILELHFLSGQAQSLSVILTQCHQVLLGVPSVQPPVPHDARPSWHHAHVQRAQTVPTHPTVHQTNWLQSQQLSEFFTPPSFAQSNPTHPFNHADISPILFYLVLIGHIPLPYIRLLTPLAVHIPCLSVSKHIDRNS